MAKSKYIARLTSPELNSEIKEYLKGQNITIIKYLKALQLIIFETERDLLNQDIKYLKDIERDQEIHL